MKKILIVDDERDIVETLSFMLKAKGYEEYKERLKIINHKLGHRPPLWALDEGYDFLDKWLK